jgi:hypothetical protein
MRNAIIVSMLCSVLVGCGVEEGIGAHAVWITTPDAGDGCPIVCDPAGGFTADGCCEAVAPPSQPVQRLIGAAAAEAPSSLTVGGPDFYGARWIWPTYGASMFYPLTADPGCLLGSVKHRVRKDSDAATHFTVDLVGFVDGTEVVLASASNTANAPGVVNIVSPAAAVTVSVNVEYSVRVSRTGGPSGVDHSFWSAVDLTCP